MNLLALYQHELILTVLIVIIGGLAGYINSLRYSFSIQPNNDSKWRYILSGVGAAILVPLFLNMLSSNLIRQTNDFDNNSYFVFAGFCFIAGYFSDRFIDSIGDKLLKEIQQTQELVNSTSDKLEKTSQDLKENKEKIDALVDSEAEMDDESLNNISLNDLIQKTELNDDDMPVQVNKIIKSFKGEYKFRSTKGIAKELNYKENIVDLILDGLEAQGAVKKFEDSNSRTLWSLTRVGQLMNQETKN
ncbi:YEATS-associated helix-containing protein [Mucilaginibacter puniceus]